MNIYFVSAGEVTERGNSDIDPPETYFLVQMVAALTRSKATYLVWKKHEWVLGDLNEQRWQTKLVARSDRPAGILDWDDVLWKINGLPEKLRP